jgi:hypothetical protein
MACVNGAGLGEAKRVRGGQRTGRDEQLPDLETLKLDELAMLKKASRGEGDVNVPLVRGICHGSATQPQGCDAIATCALSRVLSLSL